MTLEIISLVVGLVMSFFLFRHFPRLSAGAEIKTDLFLSVIIPARNEEKNLPLILGDLKDQVGVSYEVICVDDGSSDQTRAMAEAFGIHVISVRDKPVAWLGKSWACQKGAQAAKGEVLLFVDADVRLGPDGLKRLLGAYNDLPLSVLPYHRMERPYEQLSLFFNLTQVSANGLAMPGGQKIGLYGPIILIGAGDYWQIGGHDRVKDQVIEDVALGGGYAKKNLSDFSTDNLNQFLVESCRAEITHIIAIFPFWVFGLFASPQVVAIMLIYALAANIPCVLVQRYNRPRIGKLVKIQMRRDKRQA